MLAGLAAAAAALAVGAAVAGLVEPAAAPLTAIGSTLIDAAPTPAKEFAVRTFGTNDKPVLLTLVALVVAVLAAVIGLVAWRFRAAALTAIGFLGVIGMVAALARPGANVFWAVPSIASAAVGVGVLLVTTMSATKEPPTTPAAGDQPVETAARRRRRTLLVGLGAGVILAALGSAGTAASNAVRTAGSAARRLLTLPGPGSAAPAIPADAQVAGNTAFSTPTKDFYRVDIALVTPSYSADSWSMQIDGMVDHPTTLSYQQLLALPMIERDITLTCVSNEVGGAYLSTGRWLGVPFSEILKLVGPQQGVEQLFSYSLDSGYTCSTPYQALAKVANAMVAVGLNGEPLTDAHGFPARMLVPGLFGFVSGTKWLKRLEFTTYAQREAYWTKRKWATDAPILTQSRIDVPTSLSTLPKGKPVLAGVAWAQERGIKKVELRVDGGDWKDCKLAADAGIDLWRQWSYVFDGPAGDHTAEVRATDETGNTQPEHRTKVFPSGATGWHSIRFTSV